MQAIRSSIGALWRAIPHKHYVFPGLAIASGAYGLSTKNCKRSAVAMSFTGIFVGATGLATRKLVAIATPICFFIAQQTWPKWDKPKWAVHNLDQYKARFEKLSDIDRVQVLGKLLVRYEAVLGKVTPTYANQTGGLTDSFDKRFSGSRHLESNYNKQLRDADPVLVKLCAAIDPLLPQNFPAFTLPIVSRWFFWKLEGGNKGVFKELQHYIYEKRGLWSGFIRTFLPKLAEKCPHTLKDLEKTQEMTAGQYCPLLNEIVNYIDDPSDTSALTLKCFPAGVEPLEKHFHSEGSEAVLEEIKKLYLYTESDWDLFIDGPEQEGLPTAKKHVKNLGLYAKHLKSGVLARLFRGEPLENPDDYLQWLAKNADKMNRLQRPQPQSIWSPLRRR